VQGGPASKRCEYIPTDERGLYMDTPRATINPEGGEPPGPTGWKDTLLRIVGPAFYDPSPWPWVRMLITAVLVFAAVLIWRWTM